MVERLPTHGNCEIIHVCCFKLPGCDNFLGSDKKTNISKKSQHFPCSASFSGATSALLRSCPTSSLVAKPITRVTSLADLARDVLCLTREERDYFLKVLQELASMYQQKPGEYPWN